MFLYMNILILDKTYHYKRNWRLDVAAYYTAYRQSKHTNRNMKMFGVLPIRIVSIRIKSNVSSVGFFVREKQYSLFKGLASNDN